MDSSDGSIRLESKGMFELKNQLGLHARAAAQLVNVASKFKSEITVRKGEEIANGKSIMGILMLAAPVGTLLEITAIGTDSRDALNLIGALIDKKFGEEE